MCHLLQPQVLSCLQGRLSQPCVAVWTWASIVPLWHTSPDKALASRARALPSKGKKPNCPWDPGHGMSTVGPRALYLLIQG